jgi:hypothetical protein
VLILIFIHRDPNTLFRGNSLATKAVDEFMKHAGMQYLHDTLKSIVDEVISVSSTDITLGAVHVTHLSPKHSLIKKDGHCPKV